MAPMTLSTTERLSPDEPAVAGAFAPEKGRVLLLDDDTDLHEVTRDFLAEQGYAVVGVRNCEEGIQEVLGGDFAVVLCDLLSAGETFYRTVERIRPWFCSRFIFLADSRADVKMIDFVRSIGGFLLKKPFQMKDLLGLLIIAEVRGKHRSVFDTSPDAPLEDADTDLPDEARKPRPAGPAQIFPDPLANSPSVVPPSRAFALVAQSLPVILALALGCEFYDARRDAATESADQLKREAEWQEIVPQLDKALANRPQINRALGQTTRLTADRDRARWTAALRTVAVAADAVIELREVHAHENSKIPGACELRIHGWAAGSQPRREADRFRQALEESLRRDGPGRALVTRFDRLEDSAAAPGAGSRIAFVIVAVVGAANSSAVAGEGSSK
jgi:CheY-like chemotaxis protein